MKRWLRKVLAHFGHAPRGPERVELQRTRAQHRRVIAKADRVIEEYRKLDGALRVYVERRR